MAKEIKRVLVRRGMAMGDTIMASCCLKPLKKKYPKAKIFYESNFPEIFGKGFPWATIVKGVDDLSIYDKVYELGELHVSLYGDTKNLGLTYSAPLPHQACAYLGVPFNPPEILCKPIRSRYSVGICPNTGRPHDTWDPLKFQELIDKLDELGFKTISFGPQDAYRFKNCRNFYPKYDLADRNDYGYGAPEMCKHVHRSARIMKGLDVVVAGDTGLMHMADAVGTSVILILTKGSPETDFYLRDAHSRIIRSETSEVKDLSVSSVYGAVCRVLFEKGKLIY